MPAQPVVVSVAGGVVSAVAQVSVDSSARYLYTVDTEFGPAQIDLTGFPNPDNTGPRIAESEMTVVSGFSTSADGQVVEGLVIAGGRLKVRHQNVTVRDCIIRPSLTYGIDFRPVNGQVIKGGRVEFCEIDGSALAEEDIPIYGEWAQYTIHRCNFHSHGRSARTDRAEATFSENFIHTSRSGGSGSHRGGIGNNGGHGSTVIGNTVIISSASGASGAVLFYGDIAPSTGHRIIGNLMAARAGYITYGGSVGSDTYPEGSDIEFRDNRYSTVFGYPTGGRSGFMSSWDGGVRGNVATGNVHHETGDLLSFNTG